MLAALIAYPLFVSGVLLKCPSIPLTSAPTPKSSPPSNICPAKGFLRKTASNLPIAFALLPSRYLEHAVNTDQLITIRKDSRTIGVFFSM
ncbi:hypothetical protein BC829DRAFT_401083 [Chytridium lagenaria]|nr:hypothetical protein BC829DRAFT_401083 [Chytridium lagenaria]